MNKKQEQFLKRVEWNCSGWDDKTHVHQKFNDDAYRDTDGIVRWKSNDSIPPDHCLAGFVLHGLLSIDDAMRMNEIRKREDEDFLTRAFNDLPNEWDADPETLMEARANTDDEETELVSVLGRLNLKTGKWRKH